MIKRKLYPLLKEHLGKREITLITGPRQAGKTTLLLLLKRDLENEGQKTLMFNLDIEADRQFFVSQTALVQRVELTFGKKGGFVFIDEIQRKEDAGVFLKGIFDMNLPYKFIVSGSGSLELKEHIHESLAGRKRIFELSTLSFEEFANHKTNYEFEGKLKKYFDLDREKALALLMEYMRFGGYPKAVLAEDTAEKQNVLNEIFQSYMEKDIAYLLRIKKTEDFTKLVKILASQIGRLVHGAELSRTLGLAQQTIQQYLWYLEKTFIIKKITPYWKNVRKEITKAPLYYFTDLGFRNFALGALQVTADFSQEGFLFQNFIYRMIADTFLIENIPANIHFWRTKQGGEIDFIIQKGEKLIPMEVKCQMLKIPEISRSFRSFMKQYHGSKSFVINLTLEKNISVSGARVTVLPYFGLLEALLEI